VKSENIIDQTSAKHWRKG